MIFSDADIAVIIIILILFIGVTLRKYLCRLNLLSFFIYSTVILNCLTLIIWGFNRGFFIEKFPSFKLYQITTFSYMKASVIILFGMMLVVSGYVLADAVIYKGRIYFRNLFNQPPRPPIALINSRIILITLIVLALESLLIFQNKDEIMQGILLGIIGGDHGAIIEARYEINSSYIFFVWTLNILPITSISLYTLYRTTGKYRAYAISYVAITMVCILLTFFKSHIIIYLGLLALVNMNAQTRQGINSGTNVFQFKNIKYALFLFAIIVSLYAMFGLARSESSLVDAILELGGIASSRIIGRLGISILMYGHYFPEVSGHYGFSNINLFSTMFDFEVFSDTKAVFDYYSIKDEGSVAINAIMDFYAAFGWPGWLLGCVLLGGIINYLDRQLSDLGNSVPDFVIRLYGLVFVYYLTQASIFRASLGYGGLFFLIMWLAMKVVIHSNNKKIQKLHFNS